MQDIVLSQRTLTYQDLILWSLVAQLTPEEVEESIQLIRDLMDDRGRPYPDARPAPAPSDPPVVAD